MITIQDQGIVYEPGKNPDRQSSAFSHICVLPTGRWLCSLRAAPQKAATTGQHVCIATSDDQGRSWSDPVAPFLPPAIDNKPGLFRAIGLTALGGDNVLVTLYWVDYSNPELPLFNEATEGLLDSHIMHARSSDGGDTWTEPVLMDTTPFNQPTPITGPALLMPDGTLVCQFELNKHYNDPAVWRHSSVLMLSKDNGKTFPEHTIASNDPDNRIFYWDQRPAVMNDGSILDVFWTYDNKSAKYLNIHARRLLPDLKTWSDMWDTGVPGQPAPIVPLKNNTIAMVYVDRTADPVIKARLSSDDGKTFPDDSEIIIYKTQLDSQTWNKQRMQDAWAEMGKYSIGLPHTAQLNDSEFLTTFYAGPHTDHTAVRWARLKI